MTWTCTWAGWWLVRAKGGVDAELLAEEAESLLLPTTLLAVAA